MKGSDETHDVGLGSSLHGSLLLVLFLRFCLVFCLLDLGFVVGGGGGGGDGCDEREAESQR
jgi:hypothetical protein